MEDTPLVAKGDTDKESQRRAYGDEKQEVLKTEAKKPEAIGMLAVETKSGLERIPEAVSGLAGRLLAPERSMPENQSVKPAEGERARGHIGHMLLNTETGLASRAAEEKMKVETAPTGPPAGKRIDTLNRVELMALGEQIVIDGSNLRQLYETHLIGERGLRRLVAEHMKGGDLRKALRQEVLEREKDFERDPAMRDHLPPSPGLADSDNPTLEELLQKAEAGAGDNSEEAAFLKARARYKAVNQGHQYKQQRRFIDVSMILIITILVVLVIFMYLARV